MVKYCIDTSSLINIKDNYPRDTFPTLWKNLSVLITKKKLIAPREVKKEIERGDDELVTWAKEHKEMFINEDENQMSKVSEIQMRFPGLVKDTDFPPKADPWIIALAILENSASLKCIVVADEKFTEEPPRIPYVCKVYGVECLNRFDFFRREKWIF